MKLLRLDAKAANAAKNEVDIGLAIHPQMTIVFGASGAMRDRLIDAIAGIPKGIAPAGGVIEVAGVNEDLSSESLARLGLKTDLDVVVRAADLPGHDLSGDVRTADRRACTGARDEARSALQRAEAAVEAATQRLDAASALLAELQAGKGQASSVVESAAADRDEAVAELESATRELARVDAEIAQLQADRDSVAEARRAAELAADAEAEAAVASELLPPSPQISELEQQRVNLQRRVAALAAQDPEAVMECLERIERTRDAAAVPVPAALAFADAWRDLYQQLAALERTETDEERQARTRLDAARRAAVDAERDLRVSILAPESVAGLEAAHRAVLDAEEKTNSRFSGTRARIRLDQLRAVERNFLDRLGFASYADYMMSSSSRGVGAGKRAVLQTARIRVAEVEAEWQALGGDPAREAWRVDLLDQRSAMAPRIALLLGHEPDGADAEQELRDLRSVPPVDEALITELGAALSDVGLEVAAEDLGQEDLLRLARAWLDENGKLDQRRAALEKELMALDGQLTEAAGSPSGGAEPADADAAEPKDPQESQAEAKRRVAEIDRRLAEADAAFAAAQHERAALLEREAAARERVAALDAPEAALSSLLAEAEAEVAQAGDELGAAGVEVDRRRAELSSAEERLAALDEELATATTAASGEEREELIEEIEWYLLARLAAQRTVGDAGSVPLVLDDTFRDLDVAEAVRVLESVERMSGAVQVIAVSDDRALSFWAEALGEDRARVVSLGL